MLLSLWVVYFVTESTQRYGISLSWWDTFTNFWEMFHGCGDTSFKYFSNLKFEGQIYLYFLDKTCYLLAIVILVGHLLRLLVLWVCISLKVCWVCMFLNSFVSLLCRSDRERYFSLFLSHINKNFDVNFFTF